MAEATPDVALLVATYNEAESIAACLESLADQDYAGRMRVVVADGGSSDETMSEVARFRDRLDLTIIANPERRQGPGLNRAAASVDSEYLIRIDAHTVYAPDYVSHSMAALQASGAAAAGGALVPVGTTPFGRAVAAAMRSPLATGPGRFHRKGMAGEVDTVYLGVFRRADFMALGGYRSFPSGAGEDADLYHRMRRRGWRVHLDPKIRSTYRPRQTPGSLLRQQFRYGQAKAEMLWANGAFPSWRPLAPALLVAGVVAGVAVAIAGPLWPLGTLLGLWLLALAGAWATARGGSPLVVPAAALMHLGYGMGLWWGLLRGPGRVRRMVRSPGD
ncbi:MAG TPA: hypothetical protein DCY40_01070 [Actinobacteria bacterium]|nr:hypothetical protein [Actinomycetota bacterium]